MDAGTTTRPGDASGRIVKIPIALHYADCKYSFSKLFKKLETSNDQAIARRFLDEFERFRVWAGNAGAHRTGKVSLDYRLREASHIHEELANLLGQLNGALSKGRF